MVILQSYRVLIKNCLFATSFKTMDKYIDRFLKNRRGKLNPRRQQGLKLLSALKHLMARSNFVAATHPSRFRVVIVQDSSRICQNLERLCIILQNFCQIMQNNHSSGRNLPIRIFLPETCKITIFLPDSCKLNIRSARILKDNHFLCTSYSKKSRANRLRDLRGSKKYLAR